MAPFDFDYTVIYFLTTKSGNFLSTTAARGSCFSHFSSVPMFVRYIVVVFMLKITTGYYNFNTEINHFFHLRLSVTADVVSL